MDVMKIGCGSCCELSVRLFCRDFSEVDGKEVYVLSGKCPTCGSIYTMTVLSLTAN